MRYSLKLTLNSREQAGAARASYEINDDFIGTWGRAVLRVGLSVWLFGWFYAPFAFLFAPRPFGDGASYFLTYLLMGLFILYFFCWHHADREVITVTDRAIILRREFWHFGRSVSYDLRKVAAPEYVPSGAEDKGVLHFRYGTRSIETTPGLSSAEAQKLLDQIPASQVTP